VADVQLTGACAQAVPDDTIRAPRSRTLVYQGLAMVPSLRDLLAHSEWANAVFFLAWTSGRLRASGAVDLDRVTQHGHRY
jgi:hypothetical protein